MDFETMTARLAALRVHPLTMEIPFPQAGRHVHFYFVEDSLPTLIDTGIHAPASRRWLEKALRKLGYALGDIRRVLLTHGHIDHYGNARLFQELGAEIFLHRGDWNKVQEQDAEESEFVRRLYRREFIRHGFPESLVEHLGVVMAGNREHAQPLHDGIREVRHDDRIPFDRFEARVVEVPGHTPGCVAYFLGNDGVAVTGDHLLKTISPNPLFELNAQAEKFPSLVTYFDSLSKILREPLSLALPAHGPFVTDARALAESLAAFYARRQGKLFRMLEQPAQAFELCQTYYRRLKDFEVFLGFSEILGNLEMMAVRGEIRLEQQGEAYRYARISDEPVAFALAS